MRNKQILKKKCNCNSTQHTTFFFTALLADSLLQLFPTGFQAHEGEGLGLPCVLLCSCYIH